MKGCRTLISICLVVLLSGCAFSPKVSEEQPLYASCPTITKQLTLELEPYDGRICGSGFSIEECLMGVVLLPTVTFVVSGSAVLVGNTLHWLEYETRCAEGFVHQTLASSRW